MFSSHSQKMPKKPATGGIVNSMVPNMSQAGGSAGDIVVPNMWLAAGSAGDIVTMAPPIDFSCKVAREMDAELTSAEGRAARRSLMRRAIMIDAFVSWMNWAHASSMFRDLRVVRHWLWSRRTASGRLRALELVFEELYMQKQIGSFMRRNHDVAR
jgi:hypothetical protein